LYIQPCSSNFFVQTTILYQLQRAAESELIKATASDEIVESDIMQEAEEGIDALATILAEDEWFFASQRPTLFDASVFAYTQLILDENMGWQDNKLGDHLRHRSNLIQHRDRILDVYF
jgi:metaxin